MCNWIALIVCPKDNLTVNSHIKRTEQCQPFVTQNSLYKHLRCHMREIIKAATTQQDMMRENSKQHKNNHALLSHALVCVVDAFVHLIQPVYTLTTEVRIVSLHGRVAAKNSQFRHKHDDNSAVTRTCRVSALRQSSASSSPWYSAMEFIVHTAANANDAQMNVMMMFSFSSSSTATVTFGTTVICRNAPTTPLAMFANAIK